MRWSLDQLEILIACAERGSFSAAARHLGRAQSAISTASNWLAALAKAEKAEADAIHEANLARLEKEEAKRAAIAEIEKEYA